jgi:hypothetical protein
VVYVSVLFYVILNGCIVYAVGGVLQKTHIKRRKNRIGAENPVSMDIKKTPWQNYCKEFPI